MIMGKSKKRGVSPVIATILLIALVMIISVIIFLFMRGIGEESITKFGNENIKLACQKVDFEASYSDGSLAISNLGEVPIFDMNVRLDRGGNYETKALKELSQEWPSTGLAQGGVALVTLPSTAGVKKLTITPILVGKTKQGAKKSYSCEQGLYESEIIL
jgi:FlaG/FlaF family flagellin (archaellin)